MIMRHCTYSVVRVADLDSTEDNDAVLSGPTGQLSWNIQLLIGLTCLPTRCEREPRFCISTSLKGSYYLYLCIITNILLIISKQFLHVQHTFHNQFTNLKSEKIMNYLHNTSNTVLFLSYFWVLLTIAKYESNYYNQFKKATSYS